jgi:hypothetical protein
MSLPQDYARRIELDSGRTALQVLEDQLDLLDSKTREIADAVLSQDAQRLLVHGRFLEDQFENRSVGLRF